MKKLFILLFCLTALFSFATAQEKGTQNPEIQQAQYLGGTDALYQYINQNLKYPTVALENNVQGIVVVQFLVKTDGSVDSVRVLKSVHESLDAEAVRVVSSMGNWIPAKQNGTNVVSMFTLPIRFSLETTSKQKDKDTKKK